MGNLSEKERAMLEVFLTPRNRIRTLILLVVCSLSAIAAAVIGISDNLPGILLVFLAVTSFVLAFVHPWRTSRQFRRLLYTSALGLVVFGVLHNVFEAIGGQLTGSGFLQGLVNGAGVAFFLITILICPPGIVIGAIGALVMFIKNRHGSPPNPA
jgi:hypothetical protein